MKNIEGFKTLLEQEEGVRMCVYDDATGKPIETGSVVKGNPTIGVGRLIDSRHGLSMHEINYILDNDIAKVELLLGAHLPWWKDLPEAQQHAVASMAFQMGVRGLLTFKRMLVALQSGDGARAAAEALDSQWARQTPARAARIAAMMEG